jgi:coenzyme F420-reducing hydrogenase beta subunit
MEENNEGFLYPGIDSSKCINCGRCDAICPELNKVNAESINQSAFYGWHKNEAIRANSSSGGAFSAIAEQVLDRGGVVFGAIHDLNQKKVRHVSTNEFVLPAFRKSKYVQSYIGKTFREVEKCLREEREVFFIGTPCQVGGLKAYLKKDYFNLLACDFICHGVPPMKLLNDHLKLLEKKYKSKIVTVDFRPKTCGWSIYTLKCTFSNDFEYKKNHAFDGYFAAFLNNLSLRSSCYQCQYSNKQHQADLTIADYWGYRRFNADINDEKGLSLIITNTSKGKLAINKLRNMIIKPINWKYAEYVFCQHDKDGYYKNLRNEFFNYYLSNGWKRTISRFRLQGTLRSKAQNMIRNILKKFKTA